MSEPFLGEIIMFAGNFAPRGWALCDGQLLSISNNQALFSILGTAYGGDGRTSFALPDLRSRAPIHAGQGNGLTSHKLGDKSGAEYIRLTTDTLPQHQHAVALSGTANVTFSLKASTTDGNTSTPGPTAIPAKVMGGLNALNAYTTVQADTTLLPDSASTTVNVEGNTGMAGAGQPLPIVPPVLAVNFIIATVGDFPSRN
jgi:microcystin-dependent protein